MAAGERVAFNELPGAARERFVRCVAGDEEPAPIASMPSPSSRGARLVPIVVAATVVLALALAGYGTDPDALATTTLARIAAWYGASIFALAASIAFAVRAHRRATSLPWPPGRYLFPAAFVDATTSELRVARLVDLVRARVVELPRGRGSFLELELATGRALVPRTAGDEELLTVETMLALRKKLARLAERPDPAALARLDPFAPSVQAVAAGGYRAPKRGALAAEGPRARSWNAALERPVALAALVTLALGASLVGWLLPAIALDHARASHTRGALAAVARAYPFGWVEAAAGTRARPAGELVDAITPRLRDRGRASALRELLESARDRGDGRVRVFVDFAAGAARSATLGADARRRIVVALQRALGFPPEAMALELRDGAPGATEPLHVRVACATKPSSRTYTLGDRAYEAFALACDAWSSAPDRSPTRVATAALEPPRELDPKAVEAATKKPDDDPAGPAILDDQGAAKPEAPVDLDAVVARLVVASEAERAEDAFRDDLFAP